MKKFNKINNIAGWLTFIIAATVYLLTIEPTTSFWDCGEFIATAYKLEVGHPPGAPLFMIMARVASLFSFGDVTLVAKMVNSLSAIVSALTIMFLFWTITHISRKLIGKKIPQKYLANKVSDKSKDTDLFSLGQLIAIIGSGLVGALAFTFSDTFWFSAVEGEVYASSSLFTAVVFWAILKWENVAHEKYSNRWLILIAYLMGLSIGIHLLNLLAVPAIVFVYYFKKYKPNQKGVIIASLIAVVLLATIMYGIIPGMVTVASKFELLFVNKLGLPFNTGVMTYILLLLGTVAVGLYMTFKNKNSNILCAISSTVAISLLGVPFMLGFSSGAKIFIGFFLTISIGVGFYYMAKKNKVLLNTILLAGTVIIIGYSSFAMIVIRSLANPPMDENNPDNSFSLLSYLNREQYGDRPLFYGQYYSAPGSVGDEEGKPVYTPIGEKYEITDNKINYEYDNRFKTIFPRMYSPQSSHVSAYKSWAGVEGVDIQTEDRNGEPKTINKPTFGENLSFFFTYQLKHMYLRYFMWNFVGRQNDRQGHGGILKGNWISGIPVVDDILVGNQDKLPDTAKDNKANNKYYFLPLILGIIGFIFVLNSDIKSFWVLLLFFFFTGIAIVIYLNQTPYQPRERDYAYVGSFYAFAIYIGLGVAAIYKFIVTTIIPSNVGNGKTVVASIVSVLWLILVPGILASENWDDHDRSGRYTARDLAYNYLTSCAPNAILFTYGDNDTFPLWYAQEVEGIRTDVRVVNLSLLSTDWYITQMKRKAYESEAVPFSLTIDKYIQGKRDILPLLDNPQVFIQEKYNAKKNKFADRYKQIFNDGMAILQNSKFTELHKQDFEKLLEGYENIPPLTFTGLIRNLTAEKEKYELDNQIDTIKLRTDTLLNMIVTSHLPLKTAMEFVASDDEDTKLNAGYRKPLNYIPSKKLSILVDIKKVKANGTVPAKLSNKIVSSIDWTIGKNYVGKNELMILDLLATNNWDRPVYFASSVGSDNFLGLQDYFQCEGFAYRLVPCKMTNDDGEIGSINTSIMYDNVINKFKWGRMNEDDVFIDEQNKRTMMVMEVRNVFARLAKALIDENKNDKAEIVLDKCMELMPHEKVPFDYYLMPIVEAYYIIGKTEKANNLLKKMSDIYFQNLTYYNSLQQRFIPTVDYEKSISMKVLNELSRIAKDNKQEEISEEITNKLLMYVTFD